MSNGRQLHIGILCSGLELPHWQAQCIRHLADQPGVRIVALGIPKKALHPTKGLRSYLATQFAELLFPRSKQTVQLPDALDGLPLLPLPPRGMDGSVEQAFEKHGAEVLLSFLPNVERLADGSALDLWHFEVNGQGINELGLLSTSPWMLDQAPATATLWSSAGQHAEAKLTDHGALGTLDMDSVMAGAVWLPVVLYRSLGSSRTPVVERTPVKYKAPPLAWLLWHWSRLELRRTFAGRSKTGRSGEWNVGIFPHPISALLSEEGNVNVRWLPSPSAGGHRSEPFGYQWSDGQLNMLFRKSESINQLDSIARLRPKKDGNLKRSRTMLSTLATVGYPYVVTRPEGVFAVVSYPHQNRTELFRVSEGNDALDHVKTLLERALINASCFEHEGRWWLLGTDIDAPDGVLRAYHAAEFDGPYTPHALDPVKMSGSGCRPAGTPFVHEGQLWRPSLDTSDPQVPGIIFNRVVELTPTTFHEEAGRVLNGFEGTQYGDGIRTVCAMGDLTLVDGLRHTPEAREIDISERSTARKAKAYTE